MSRNAVIIYIALGVVAFTLFKSYIRRGLAGRIAPGGLGDMYMPHPPQAEHGGDILCGLSMDKTEYRPGELMRFAMTCSCEEKDDCLLPVDLLNSFVYRPYDLVIERVDGQSAQKYSIERYSRSVPYDPVPFPRRGFQQFIKIGNEFQVEFCMPDMQRITRYLSDQRAANIAGCYKMFGELPEECGPKVLPQGYYEASFRGANREYGNLSLRSRKVKFGTEKFSFRVRGPEVTNMRYTKTEMCSYKSQNEYYHADGKLAEVYDVDGAKETYYPDGTLRFERLVPHNTSEGYATARGYYSNGKIQWEESRKPGDSNYKVKHYNMEGNVTYETTRSVSASRNISGY